MRFDLDQRAISGREKASTTLRPRTYFLFARNARVRLVERKGEVCVR